MASKPGFLTGASAKVKLNDHTVAYAQDVSYTTDLEVMPIEVMGSYEVVAYEPLAYRVRGSMSIVRYTKNTKTLTSIPGTSDSGNAFLAGGYDGAADDAVSAQFDPSKIIQGSTCDLVIYQKQWDGTAESLQEVVKIRDVKFTQMSGTLNKRGNLVVSANFVGMLVDEDGVATTSNISLVGDDFT
jgi:hypothetical protein